MQILQKYLLALFISCLPGIHLQDKELFRQEQQSIHKDSVSETEEPLNYEYEEISMQTEKVQKTNNNDTILKENIQWKFRKHLILGN